MKIIKKEDSMTLWMLLWLPFITFLDRKYGRENVFQQNISKAFLGKANYVQKGVNIIVNDKPIACCPEGGPLYKQYLFLVKKELGEEFLEHVNSAVDAKEVAFVKTKEAADKLRTRINEYMLTANIKKGELQ